MTATCLAADGTANNKKDNELVIKVIVMQTI